MEKPVRTLMKTLSWRIVATSTTVILVFLLTKDIMTSASVGLLEVLVKTIIYFVHERAWNLLDFGRENFKPHFSTDNEN
jgi:uncharacterized membrane protein